MENKKIICNDCGKTLPTDSEFCQYCGSSNIETLTSQIVKESNREQDINNNKALKNNILFMPLILVSLLAIGLGYGMYSNYIEHNKLYEYIQKTASSSTNNERKASNYDLISKYARNGNGYVDFYARQTILVKPVNHKVWVYYSYYNSNVYLTTSSRAVKAEWGNSEGNWMPLTISYSGNGVEYVKLTCDANNEEIYITVIGY